MLDFTQLPTLDALIRKQRELAADLKILDGVITRLRIERAREANLREPRNVAA
jgi:hypothetical protein